MPFDPEAVREFERTGWNRAAATYEATFAAASRQFIDPLLDAIGLNAPIGPDVVDLRAAGVDAGRIGPGAAVLDLCCGPGLVAAAASARGANARGLDFSAAMLAEARSRYPAIAFDQGDAEAPPYPDATFDAVVSNFGIHHVPRPGIALNQMHRILRVGGQLAFSIWSGRDENIAWKLVLDAVDRHGNPHASAAPPPGGGFASPADCLRALDAAGFAHPTANVFRGVWRHADAASLLAAFRGGTARMAAVLEAQAESAMPAILAAIEADAMVWRDQDGQLAVPIACVIAAGVKR